MVFTLFPTGIFAAGTQQADKTVILACSDFQNKSCTSTNHAPGVAAVQGIIDTVKTVGGITAIDGFFCCGDYYYTGENSTTDSANGMAALSGCITDNFGSSVEKLFVQGNHDGKNAGLASTGAHDADAYGVYVLDEDDYQSYNVSQQQSQTIAAGLKTYFDAKIEQGYDKPVFVISHVPLHAGVRTVWTGYDNCALWGKPIFDTINTAAEDLNIFFLFGHNHSKDHDSYLGGSAIFLQEGDPILVANGVKDYSSFTEETLNFTYMNAGYVGYYESYSNADSTLTMTTFEIEDNSVTINRYDNSGLHVLKHAGDHTTYRGSDANATQLNGFANTYAPYTDTCYSPVTVSRGTSNAVPQTFTDPSGISVTTTSGTGLTVSSVTVPQSVLSDADINRYVAYDIILADYEQGVPVKVSMPVPADFHTGRTRIYHVNDNGTLEKMSATVRNGAAEFTTDHFSTYMVAEMNESPVSDLNWIEIPGESNYVYTRYNGVIESGEKYLIVAPSNDYALVGTSRQSVTISNNTISVPTNTYEWEISDAGFDYPETSVSCDGGSYTLNNPTSYYWKVGNVYRQITKATCKRKNGTYTWTINYDGGTVKQTTQSITLYTKESIYTIKQNSRYLGNGTSLATSTTPSNWTIAGTSTYKLKNSSNYYLRYYNSSFAYNTTNSYNGMRLFKLTALPTPSDYAAMSGTTSESFTTDLFTSQNALLSYLRSRITVYTASDAEGTDYAETDDYTFGGSINPHTAGNYSLTVLYKGKVLGTVSVSLHDVEISDISVDLPGTVYVGAHTTALTGSHLTVTYSDGSTMEIPVNLGMVTGDYNAKKVGTYSGLKVSFDGFEVDYTLNVVVNPDLDPFPKTPDEGSVSLSKTATGLDFQNTGVAQIELSAKGIPYQRGIDVIIMLDSSSSMVRTPASLNGPRSYVFSDAFRDLLVDLQNAEGDIRVAIGDFNGFGSSGQPYSQDRSTDTMQDGQYFSATETGRIYTGVSTPEKGTAANLTASAFVDVDSIDTDSLHTMFHTTSSKTSGTPYQSGTNYDYAFWATYQLGSAITAQNAANEEERELIVVFMTDGSANQYNGYTTNASSTTATPQWSYWLVGSPDGATVGTEESTFTQYAKTTHSYFFGGVGSYAQKHRWNEAIKGDPTQQYEVIDKTQNTAAGPDQYMTSVPGLGATVYSIGFALEADGYVTQEVAEHLVRQMATSEQYYHIVNSAAELESTFAGIKGDILEAASEATFDDQMGSEFDLQMADFGNGSKSSIEVVTYDIYKHSDYKDGLIPLDLVGSRKSATPTVVEKITFNAAGTAAYSSLLGSNTNILKDGLIVAKNFVYNTTGSTKTVSFNGKTVNVEAESFYWNLGTVKEIEYALRYNVYLTGTMEGTREAGTYPTNDHATLEYVNYAGAEVSQEAPKPEMAWQAAVIYYAAYLVNADGQPVNARGEVTGFADRVAVTNPNEGDKVLFGNAQTVEATVLASALPQEYVLFDSDASYKVTVNTGTHAGSWIITSGQSTHTTYVTGFASGDEYSNALTDNNVSHNYTATTVWFAVRYNVGAIKDDIVVDYGLPVDISVLSNDMFYENGVLVAIGPEYTGTIPTESLPDGFGSSFESSHGKASIRGNYVRYQLNDMNMNHSDTFSYAVRYTDSATQNVTYYYGNITVIPATSIYYEESFFESDLQGVWEYVGTRNTTATQNEDRVGFSSITTIDANNVYGMDNAYADCTTYSLGGAWKATATEGSNATAAFTFTGTGFDVISLVDSKAGFITVKVCDAATDAVVKNLVVNNYFQATGGYSTLYQIPVIAVEGLAYGQYNVTVTVAYNSYTDTAKTGSTTFVLDAIRTYNPAGIGGSADPTVRDAYKVDKEYKPVYQKIRSLLINANALSSDSAVTGACFVEMAGETAELSDYTFHGPNNECYLAYRQAIAFDLSIPARSFASIQLGSKVLGTGGKLNLQIKIGENTVKTVEITVKSAADLFYDLSNYFDLENGGSYTLVITNMGSSLISLTRLKTTTDPRSEVVKQLAMTASPRTALFAKNTVTALFAAPPAEPEVPEVEVFEPSTFKASLSKASVNAGDSVTVNITTSGDVASVTVDGAKATLKKTNKRTDEKTWSYTYKTAEPGEIELSIVAYDANGVASEPIISTLTVKATLLYNVLNRLTARKETK